MKAIGIKQTFLIAGIIYFIDAFVFNQGVIALLVGFVAVLVFIIRFIVGLFMQSEPLKNRAIKLAIYVLMAVAVIGTNQLNNMLARHRAEDLIRVCEQYKAKYQKFPDRLEDLVPEFIPKVPIAKYTLFSSEFDYFNSENGSKHYFWYREVPPFGRPCYFLEDKRWGYYD